VGGWPCTRSRGELKLPDHFHSIRACDCTPTFIPILVDSSRSTGKRVPQADVFRGSAAFQDSPSKMLHTSTHRPPAGRSPSVGVGPKAMGRRAKSTRSMLPAFDFGVAPRLPLSWPTPQYRLRRYAVAGPQVAPGSEDDAAMLATASSRLGGTTEANSPQGCEPQRGQNVPVGRPL
jgi:hypothetical protein